MARGVLRDESREISGLAIAGGLIAVFSVIGLMLVLTGAVFNACSFVSGLVVLVLGAALVVGLGAYAVSALRRRGRG